ncbi:RHS repeat protein [Flavobacterium cucumis]|uniref:RHS repeat protein n=1 Tax=Flavobacterium cucumis TaxID=416016 RepID=UPI000936A3FF|nr:RHS repeat-associated core domain-containing protein [Flavobacterium cucumis]
MPTEIQFGTLGNIKYIYNATGQKVSKIVSENSVITTHHYQSGYQYENGNLQFFPHVEGYVNVVSGAVPTYNYVYQYKDHLGNNRLSYATTTQASQTQLTILEESHYYPFGLKHAPYNNNQYQFIPPANGNNVALLPAGQNGNYQYKYNGKEYQDELGLNVTAMDFRQYDSAIGRFNGMDRLAEMAPGISPYRFGFNNPIMFSDPTGLIEKSVLMDMFKRSVDDVTTWTNNRTDGFETSDGGYVGHTSDFTDFNQTPNGANNLPGVTVIGDINTGSYSDAVISGAANQISYNIHHTNWYDADYSISGSIAGGLAMGGGALNLKSYQFFGADFSTVEKGLRKSGSSQYFVNGQSYWQGNYKNAPISVANQSKLVGKAKFMKATGKAMGAVGVVITAYQIKGELQNQRYYSAGARGTVALIAAGSVFIPGVGWGIALGIGVADAIWSDQFYNYIENEFGDK